jgi:hypothetical protein
VLWLEPWRRIRAVGIAAAALYESELKRELSPGHPLFGVPAAALGKRNDSDDVLFELRDGTGRVAVVHLTFCNHPEPPPWPQTTMFASLEAWVEERMKAGHEAIRG